MHCSSTSISTHRQLFWHKTNIHTTKKQLKGCSLVLIPRQWVTTLDQHVDTSFVSKAANLPAAALSISPLTDSMVAASFTGIAMQFTPVPALLGGLTLGVAVVGKLAITGRILGISGALKGFVQNNITSWRVLFTLGMVGGALVAKGITPGAFDVLPSTFTVTRAAVGGLLVGLGAALGNGCTSGHGICGNARLSIRSAVYTMVFMASGMVTATLSHTAEALAIMPRAAQLTWPTSDVSNSGALLTATALLTMLGLARAAAAVEDKKAAGLATELASGALFSFGLVYTGMVRPTKVAAFLSPLHPAWDLSLMLVMGGALLVALPGVQAITRLKVIAKPYAAERFEVPTVNSIDPKLLLGGVLFGIGWGLSGMCPGPAVVAAVATPLPQVLAYVGAMLGGMWLQGVAWPSAQPVVKQAAS